MSQLNFYIIVCGFFIGIIFLFKFPKLTKQNQKQSDTVTVSIVIPARNEEKNLPAILSDLARQIYPVHEIICADDCSEDRTSEIIDAFGAISARVTTLADGWKGKPWACQCGALKATGQLLLFVDADVRLSPDALGKMVEQYKKTGNPVSVQPYHTVKKPYEFLSMLFNVVQTFATRITMPLSRKHTGFFGPVFMIERELFFKHDGYGQVKNKAVEDLYLGKYYSENGITVDLFLGDGDISFRMYGGGVLSLIEGWAKNFSGAALAIKPLVAAMLFVWVTYLAALPLELGIAIANADTARVFFYVGVYILTVLSLARAGRNMGSYPTVCYIFYPILLIGFILIFIYSVIATFITKSTTWKGRRL